MSLEAMFGFLFGNLAPDNNAFVNGLVNVRIQLSYMVAFPGVCIMSVAAFLNTAILLGAF